MDTAFLTFYSIGLLIMGSLCDHYNPKYLLVGSYVIVTIVISIIGYAAEMGYNNTLLFCFLFSINGFL